MTVSEALAKYVLSLNDDTIGKQVKETAKLHFLDGLACMFLGTGGAPVKTALPYVCAHTSEAELVFPACENIKTDYLHWAMLGAIAAHSNDFDDMSASLNGHPTALLLPVVLALGQKYHLDGKLLLNSYIVGVEIDAILGTAFTHFGYRKGWNATNAVGVFGATAAAAYMLGLNEQELAAALCLAVNEASGFKANFGTIGKDFAIGMSAIKAISCAECARYGFDASLDAFEGPFGFFESICGGCDAEYIKALISEHASEFITPGIVVKPYPSCRGNHSGIDCITRMKLEHGFAADDVYKIICRCDQASFDTDRYEHPKNPTQAKFSLAFCIAKILKYGKISISDFIGDEIEDTSPLELIPKIEIFCTPDLFKQSRFGSEIEVILKNGTHYREKECFAKGDPLLPMSREEIAEKLKCCMSYPFGDRAGDAVAALGCFDEAKDINDVFKSLF